MTIDIGTLGATHGFEMYEIKGGLCRSVVCVSCLLHGCGVGVYESVGGGIHHEMVSSMTCV